MGNRYAPMDTVNPMPLEACRSQLMAVHEMEEQDSILWMEGMVMEKDEIIEIQRDISLDLWTQIGIENGWEL